MELDPVPLQSALQATLRGWYDPEAPEVALLAQLLLVRDRIAALGVDTDASARRRLIKEMVLTALQELQGLEPRSSDVLRIHYLDQEKIRSIANRLNLSPDQINRIQASALQRLTEIVRSSELRLREGRRRLLEQALPLAQSRILRGVQPALDRLRQELLTPDRSEVVLLCGMGGLGKTALARALAHDLIDSLVFESYVWVPLEADAGVAPQAVFDQVVAEINRQLGPESALAPAERRERVRSTLRSRPFLVLVDNLETQAQVSPLLEQLGGLARPSKFVLTSRARPAVGPGDAFVWTLKELSLSDATDVMWDQVRSTGSDAVAPFTADDAAAVYQCVGGNPLALKLVVSLAGMQALPSLLEDLARRPGGATEDLYRHIYRRAWQALSLNARALLQAMPLVGSQGALPDQLRVISGLAESALWPAITELWSRSLLEVHGDLQEKRYGIHRLTNTFLRTDVNGFASDEGS